MGKIKPELYNKATEHLVFGKDSGRQLEDGFLDDNLKILLEQTESDASLRETLKELVEKSIAYTEETAEILDLIGSDNVVISQKDGK